MRSRLLELSCFPKNNRTFQSLLIGALFLNSAATHTVYAADATPAPQLFQQEIASHAGLSQGIPDFPVQFMTLDSRGQLQLFSEGRWYSQTNNHWQPQTTTESPEPAAFLLPEGGKVSIPWRSIRQFTRQGSHLFLVTENDILAVSNGSCTSLHFPAGHSISQAISPNVGTWIVATDTGLYTNRNHEWNPVPVSDEAGRAWANPQIRAIASDSSGQLWMATQTGVTCHSVSGWKTYDGNNGLPMAHFTSLAATPDSTLWFGTHCGAVRYENGQWHYRQGPRWLPGDDIRSVLVDAEGTAWFLTDKGLGNIRKHPMTLAEKAAFYESEIDRHLRRTPYGYVAEAPLKSPARKDTADPHDTDNDGLWTGMYGAGECFAWAATHDPTAKDRARKAFDALRFLQKVTQTGSNIPPKGYVARTIRPGDHPNPNIGRLESDKRQHEGDSQWKVYEPRWPLNGDGKWFWKSDTSSDELDGHYFFYSLYYEHCADTPEEKERVRDVVRDLTDHLLNHGLTLVDHDGQHTRWAVFGPQYLNTDPHWWPERGLNSLSCLSYLAVATQVTGDPKYEAAARELVEKHGYAQNIMYTKVQFGPGSGNQSDDEMAFMCFYTLLRHSPNETLRQQARLALFGYWINEAPEMNPFFNFTLASLIPPATPQATPETPTPWTGWLDDSMATLRGFPLDRLNWPSRNSQRLDITLLDPQQSENLLDGKRDGRGRRNNGKVIPVENRHFNHWNTDPWQLDYPGSGDELAPGTVFLLPYYMGLYHGFIQKP
jgi:hypothetical protein